MNTSKVHSGISDELERDKEAFRDTRSISDGVSRRRGKMIPVHYCYTILDGEKWFIVTALDHQVIIKKEKIEPVFEEEKVDPRYINFPVFTYHYSPMDNDPFGLSVPDLLSDKQKAMQLFMNLQKIKAEDNARGDVFLVDPSKVNVTDLIKKTN